ncbi:unnamed protein product [Mytilus edulis]|uniref:Uncharacterized protein n=1 Tax=Mytilus edulis TaxID=6550 RepID=A0A8S3S1J9_MYTED|nr:unnamed protein product [Mytilus edulis]
MLSFLSIAESVNLSSPEIVSFPVEHIGEVTVYAEDITIHLLGNTGLEFVLHHTNDVYIVNTIDRNCSCIDIDFTNIYESLRNRKCQTNLHISKLFYGVNATHNITFVDTDIIPFFDDIDITFINKQCVEDFRQFVSIHGNNRITNEDIRYFLKNVTDCMRWIALNNQTIFQVDMYQDKSLSKTGVASRKEAKIMFSFEDDACLDNFIDFVGLYGFFDVEYGNFLVSPSNINEFLSETQMFRFPYCMLWRTVRNWVYSNCTKGSDVCGLCTFSCNSCRKYFCFENLSSEEKPISDDNYVICNCFDRHAYCSFFKYT